MEENKLYDLQDEPLRLNRFVCEITLDGVEIDKRVIRGFREDRSSDTLFVDIVSYENTDYEWLIDKAYNEKIGGKLTVKWLSPSLDVVKAAKYELLWVSKIFYPQYEYGVNDVVSAKVGFKYADKHVEYFRRGNKNSKPISENDKAFLKASKELLEDAKKRVEEKYSIYENAEGTKKRVIDQLNMAERENDEFAKQVGCSDADIENAKYKEPNEFEVEKYNRYLKKKYEKVETTFDFGDFNTALEWYKYHIIPKGKQYVRVDKFDEVDRDIEENERPTIVVCSRQCGMTTHMLVWSLAKISTIMDSEIWYVTNGKQGIYSIFDKIPEEIRKLSFLRIFNGIETIKNTETDSKIVFVNINKNMPNFFCGKRQPDYVIYDDMAFYDTKKINEFLNLMDGIRRQKHRTKEICVSTPSKEGSVFNFIALTFKDTIKMPWYEVNIGDKDNTWVNKMKQILGEDNFNVELNCQIGCNEEKPKFKKERLPDDYGYVFFDTDFPVSEKEEDNEYDIEI